MQDLLEPEFVSLVNRDEQKLVVMHRVRQTVLKRYEIGHAQIFVV